MQNWSKICCHSYPILLELFLVSYNGNISRIKLKQFTLKRQNHKIYYSINKHCKCKTININKIEQLSCIVLIIINYLLFFLLQ